MKLGLRWLKNIKEMKFYGTMERDTSGELKVSKVYIIPEDSSKQIDLTGEEWYDLVATMRGEKEILSVFDKNEYLPKCVVISNKEFNK